MHSPKMDKDVQTVKQNHNFVVIDDVAITSSVVIEGISVDITNSSFSSSVEISHDIVNMTNISISSSSLYLDEVNSAVLRNVTINTQLLGVVEDLYLEDVHTGLGKSTLRVSKLWMSNSTFEKASSNTDNYYIYVSDLDNTNNASTKDVYIYNSTIKFNTSSNSDYTFVFDIDTTGDIRIIDSEINATHYRTSRIELEGSEVLIQNSNLWSGTRNTENGDSCSHGYSEAECASQGKVRYVKSYLILTLCCDY